MTSKCQPDASHQVVPATVICPPHSQTSHYTQQGRQLPSLPGIASALARIPFFTQPSRRSPETLAACRPTKTRSSGLSPLLSSPLLSTSPPLQSPLSEKADFVLVPQATATPAASPTAETIADEMASLLLMLALPSAPPIQGSRQ